MGGRHVGEKGASLRKACGRKARAEKSSESRSAEVIPTPIKIVTRRATIMWPSEAYIMSAMNKYVAGQTGVNCDVNIQALSVAIDSGEVTTVGASRELLRRLQT